MIVDGGKFDWEASGKFASLSRTEPKLSRYQLHKSSWTGSISLQRSVQSYLRDTGATISPFHSFLFLQGLETLSLTCRASCRECTESCRILEQPSTGRACTSSVCIRRSGAAGTYTRNISRTAEDSIFTFEIKGDAQKAKDFIDNLELFSLLANVADVKSLVIHPATTTHSQCTEEELLDQGIKPNTIRLSIGTENIDDIIQDLDEAFKAIQ